MTLSSSPKEGNWLGVGRKRSVSTSSNGSNSLRLSRDELTTQPKSYLDFKNDFFLSFQQSDHIPPNIALYATLSGIMIGVGATFTLMIPGQRALGFYIAALGVFHLLEYLTTAIFNPRRVKLDSFLYDPVTGYHAALATSILEYFVKKHYYPWLYYYSEPIQFIGLLLVLIGQWFRSRAMIEANTSFNHYVASMRDQDHHLITTGIYSIARHPSYLGFYLFTLGTQLVLFNPLCFAAFCFVLHKFFSSRIRVEEAHLIRFFGNDYKNYRDQTPTYLPFIS